MNINTKYDHGQEVQVNVDGEWEDATVTLIKYDEEGLEYTVDSGECLHLFIKEEKMRLKPIFTYPEFEKLGVYRKEARDLCEEAVKLYLAREPKPKEMEQ